MLVNLLLHLPTVDGHSLQWPQTWNTAVTTLRMVLAGQRLTWPCAEDVLTVSKIAHERLPEGNSTGCGVCTLMSAFGTLLLVPRLGNFASTTDRKVRGGDGPPGAHGADHAPPLLGQLPAAALSCLPAPQEPLVVADLRHQAAVRADAARPAMWHQYLMGYRSSCPWPCSTSGVCYSNRGCTLPGRGRRVPSSGCGRRNLRPPMVWGRRTWDGCCFLRAQGFSSLCGWNGEVWIGSRSRRAGRCGGVPWGLLAAASAGTTCVLWVPCARHRGALPRASHRPRSWSSR